MRHHIRIHRPELIGMLISSAEGMYDMEVDMFRDLLGSKTLSVIPSDDIKYHSDRVVAINAVVAKLKHSIPPTSHTHPTIIPLSSQSEQDVVETIIDFAWDWMNDTVNEPLWKQKEKLPTLTAAGWDELRKEINEGIDPLVAITELKTWWNIGGRLS
jgi:hypothetical protein